MNGTNISLLETVFTFSIALFLVICFTPIAMKLAQRLNIMDKPNARKTHTVAVPYLGGVAIYVAFLVACSLFVALSKEMLGILIGGTVLLIVGVIDDKLDISAKLRLVIQLGCAYLAVRSGIAIQGIGNPFNGEYISLGFLSTPLSMLWIVTVTNVMNFIDGLDGLAAGTAAIASLTLMVVAWQMDSSEVVLLSAALAGACIGFLRYNFHPAKIFMGDAGALLIGFVLACLSIRGPMKGATFATMLIPMLALGLPLFDTMIVFFKRIRAGKSPMHADRRHIHHILYDNGLTQKQTVLWLYAISICLGLSAIEVTSVHGRLISFVVGMVGVILFVSARSLNKLEAEVNTKGYGRKFVDELQEELKKRENKKQEDE
ncbi:MAG: undecaprenyl/decaprenyl-phosphate alpha-N-acetylglucosaminyl 1-phosphate transferase [Negativicutes bacterium]|nr:undecaprenyl/decaprenyl-phosphate alpha-N-acetylglucosaminyl 1-phosphate transferase [Negativicutes bacterium]